jgi:hypothetical protein
MTSEKPSDVYLETGGIDEKNDYDGNSLSWTEEEEKTLVYAKMGSF